MTKHAPILIKSILAVYNGYAWVAFIILSKDEDNRKGFQIAAQN